MSGRADGAGRVGRAGAGRGSARGQAGEPGSGRGAGAGSRLGVKSSRPAADSASVDQWDVLTPAADLRCPACAAAVRPEAPWCTLCYHDLRPADPVVVARPVVVVEPSVVAGSPGVAGTDLGCEPYGGEVLDPLTAPAEALGLPAGRVVAGGAAVGRGPAGRVVAGGAAVGRGLAGRSWPCTACGQGNAFDLSACAGCGAGFLAGVREGEAPLLDLPLVGDLTALSRAQRIWLAAGVVLAFIAMTVVLILMSN